jgi:3-oxoacyl-[acyl-carrier-protein] synthase II
MKTTMISICGMGWITGNEYGCVMKGERVAYKDDTRLEGLSKKGIFAYPFKNFGRLDVVSKATAHAVALALRDAGIAYSQERKQDIGIIGTNRSGSLASDILYFKDYVECGRTLGRGNLFIYTLPSSPLGEAAIHFGLMGPLVYAAGPDASMATALDMAVDMLLLDEASTMLAGKSEEHEAVYVVLAKDGGVAGDALCDVDQAREIAIRNEHLSGMTAAFIDVKRKKGAS